MPSAEHSVTIRRPAEVVFAYVADGERCPEWRRGVLDIERISGEGVGAVYRQGVAGPLGRRLAADYRITEYEPGRLIEFETTAGPARPRGRYEFMDVPEGTRLTFMLSADLTGLGRLFVSRAVQRTMEAEVQAIERIKQILEADAVESPFG
jgi:uncharacterized membrane protein